MNLLQLKLKNSFALRILDFVKSAINTILHSYSIIFFSQNRFLGLSILTISMIDLIAGMSGLISVVISNFFAKIIGLNTDNIKKGYFGFNALLVGLGLGIVHEWTFMLFAVLFFCSLLTLLLTVFFEGVLGKYGLPFLSVPFLFAIWIITLATIELHALESSTRGVYLMNDLYGTGGSFFIEQYEYIKSLKIPISISIYLKSLGAIFFQYNLLAGFILVIGLIVWSRVAFTLSILSFYTAYYFYQLVGADITELGFSYIGFNYILTGIALGGFFLLPRISSFISTLFMIPILAILTLGFNAILKVFGLPIFSLPFNIIVLLFLYMLKFRTKNNINIEEVAYQQFSPELNLYTQLNYKNRFKIYQYFPIYLPFWGKWTVSQGHNGEITHKEGWAFAWDFVIKDNKGSTFNGQAIKVEDFYCFNKPVIAPADGIIEEVVEHIVDNEIGDVNTIDNWGNTIIIKHTIGLYSKLCHLKAFSIKVKPGDYVKKGEIIGLCGSSGRSPEPHLHFQIQTTPFIGSKTLNYPIACFVKKINSVDSLIQYDIPLENDILENINKNESLTKAFHFIPGQKLSLVSTTNKKGREYKQNIEWEVITDVYNNTFIYCEKSNSRLYVINDGIFHQFKHFEGDRTSILFMFYLSCYKIPLVTHSNITINDSFPIHLLHSKWIMLMQDFVSPLYLFIKNNYKFTMGNISIGMDDHETFFKAEILNKSLFNNKKMYIVDAKVKDGKLIYINIDAKNANYKIEFS